jgi:hypothetical protein
VAEKNKIGQRKNNGRSTCCMKQRLTISAKPIHQKMPVPMKAAFQNLWYQFIPGTGDPREQSCRTASSSDYIVVVFGHLCHPVGDLNKNKTPYL